MNLYKGKRKISVVKKQIPKTQNICILVLSLTLAILLSACGNEGGDILEKIFSSDYSKEIAIPVPAQVICGKESAWSITTTKDDFIYKLCFEPNTAAIERIEWQPEEGDYSIINIADCKGTLYAQLKNQKDDIIEVRKYLGNSSWSKVFSIQTENKGDYSIVGSGFYVDKSENFYFVNGVIVTKYNREGVQLSVYELSGDICFFQENTDGNIEIVTINKGQISLDTLYENRVEEKWKIKDITGPVQKICSNEESILCISTNQNVLFLDKESGELLARANLGISRVASILAGFYNSNSKTLELYDSLGNGTEIKYHRFSEREDIAQRTELVYGVVEKVNSDTSSCISTAIARFNQENTKYYITIHDYNGNLDRMHTDMATGNGPDIIDMMYTEYYDIYAKNGYLENLLPYFDKSTYKDDIIWNVLNTYQIDGGLYIFVPKFQMHGFLIHPEYEPFVDEWNMDTYLGLIEKNQWEKNIFGGLVGDSETMLYHMLCGRQNEFIDREKKTADFESESFLSILSLCKSYSEADWSNAKGWTYEDLKWNTLCKPELFGGSFAYYLSNVEMYGREYPVYGYPTISGQTYGITACADSCAIYSGSKQKEGAWEFLESLLLESNQRYLGVVNPGFPIRKSIFDQMAEESQNSKVRINNGLTSISDDEIKILKNIIYEENLSHVLIDPSIWNIIYEETQAYFAGEKNAQETANIIQSRISIYLSE